jgi:hypothetical protein
MTEGRGRERERERERDRERDRITLILYLGLCFEGLPCALETRDFRKALSMKLERMGTRRDDVP